MTAATEETQMAHPTSHDDTGDIANAGPDRGSTYRTPRWVKVFGIALLVLILLIAIMHASGHSPGRHMHGMSGAVTSGQVSSVSVAGPMVHQP